MPFIPQSVPQRVIDAARQQKLVPLVGAGVSRQAGDAFPTWRELLEFMKNHAVIWDIISKDDANEMEALLSRGQYLMVAEELRSRLARDEFESLLEQRFKPSWAKPAEIHRALFRLRPPLILTTNYDMLIEDAYAQAHGQLPTVCTYRDAPVAQRTLQAFADRPFIFKLHGTISQPDEIVLSERDYRRLIYQQPGYRALVSALFITHVVIMLGFSFSDRELLLLLESLRASLEHRSAPDYIFLPADSVGKLERARLRDDFGIQVISFTPTEGYPELLEFVEFLISQMSPRPTCS